MPVDVTVPQSPGWWMNHLWKQLQVKQPRLRILDDYRRGRPPLVMGSESLRSAFYKFQRVSRSNFADLIVSAVAERQAVRSIRTAVASDDRGDSAAWAFWAGNNCDVTSTDVHRNARTFGEAYVSVGMPDEGTDLPVIVGEDPRQVITAQDPVNPRKTLAAFKIFHDPMASMDYAYLWLPGEMWVAYRPRRSAVASTARYFGPLDGPPPLVPVAFSPQAFTMAPTRDDDPTYQGVFSERYALRRIPVVRFGNRDGVGEFELHTDLLDRINHMILQRIVIATLQAFKQRAIVLDPTAGEDGKLPTHDDMGQPIDYNDLFSADPGALWTLPLGAKIWESQQVDLTGILSAVKDDAMHLGAVTRTPFSMFSSDATNQSAEGAQLSREGLVFKVEDRDKMDGRSWAEVIATAFEMVGDMQRSDVARIIIDWAPAERFSLSERAQADSQAVSLPRAQKYRLIWGMSPAEVQIALAQSSSDAMLAALGQPAPAVGTSGVNAG